MTRRSMAKLATLLAIAGLLGGCLRTATVQRRGHPDLEGRIVGGTQEWLYLEGHGGRTYQLARDEIDDIDHPGNVQAVVGSPFLAIGLAMVLAASMNREDGSSAVLVPLGVTYTALGGVLAVPGLLSWSESVALAGPSGYLEPPLLPVGAQPSPPVLEPPPAAPLPQGPEPPTHPPLPEPSPQPAPATEVPGTATNTAPESR